MTPERVTAVVVHSAAPMHSYIELPGLAEIVLEESYVLGLHAQPGELTLDVDRVLGRGHHAYSAPPPSEVECFRRGSLRFVGVERLAWDEQGSPPAIDGSGERDFGHVDSFEWDDDQYVLSGEWGRIVVKAQGVEVVLVSMT
jgi:hypothetical protein